MAPMRTEVLLRTITFKLKQSEEDAAVNDETSSLIFDVMVHGRGDQERVLWPLHSMDNVRRWANEVAKQQGYEEEDGGASVALSVMLFMVPAFIKEYGTLFKGAYQTFTGIGHEWTLARV